MAKNRGAGPKFLDISDHQLSEAIAVIRTELEEVDRKEVFGQMSVEELQLLASYRSMATVEYMRKRLPTLLGFKKSTKIVPTA